MEAFAYGLIVANGRAYVQGNYLATVVTDMAISFNAFVVGKKFVKDAENLDRVAMAGYVLGGAFGSCCSIAFTKLVYGQ